MTFAPDKNGTLYPRAMDHRPYRKTLLPGTNIIPYQLSVIHYQKNQDPGNEVLEEFCFNCSALLPAQESSWAFGKW